MKINDVTRTLAHGTYVYPGDPEFIRIPLKSGQSFISALSFGTHTGTHIDAPAHCFPAAASVAEIPLKKLITTAELVSFGAVFSCTTPAVLFRSGFVGVEEANTASYPTLSTDEAASLVACGVEVVGSDTPSIGDGEVHRNFLKMGIIIIEMLDFTAVLDGVYRMVALPLKIAGADGGHARVVLLEEEGEE